MKAWRYRPKPSCSAKISRTHQRHMGMLTIFASHHSECGEREESWIPVVNGESLPKFLFHFLSTTSDCLSYMLCLLTVRVISKTFQYFIFYFVNFTWIGICFDWSEFSPVSSWYSIQIKANNCLLWDTELTDRKKGIFNRYISSFHVRSIRL